MENIYDIDYMGNDVNPSLDLNWGWLFGKLDGVDRSTLLKRRR